MNFYRLTKYQPRTYGHTDFYTVGSSNLSDPPTCKECGKALGMLTWLPPFRVELELWWGVFGDIAFGGGDDLLISERFKHLWEEEGLVGLEEFETAEVVKVKTRRRLTGELPEYFRAKIARSNRTIDQTASEMKWEGEVCPVCRTGHLILSWKRAIFEPGLYPENIFFARGFPGVIFVDEKFKTFCEIHKIISYTLTPAMDFSGNYEV